MEIDNKSIHSTDRPENLPSSSDFINNRIQEWEEEKLTNQFGMAHFADRAITVLKDNPEYKK